MIHDVYKINETSENVDTVPYGHWSSSSGMYIEDLNIWGRRANLKGFMFRYSGQFYLYWSKTNFNQILDIHIVTCFQLITISFILELLLNSTLQSKPELMMSVHHQSVSKAIIQIWSMHFNLSWILPLKLLWIMCLEKSCQTEHG